MALPLSPNIAKAVEKLFSDENKEEVVRLLTEQCADNLPNCQGQDKYDLEDLRFQVFKLSEGNLEKLRDAVRMANEDWRDVIGAAGSVRKYKRELLGNNLERNVKSDMVWYSQGWNILGAIAAFTSMLVLRVSSASVFQSVGAIFSVAVIFAVGLVLFSRPFRGESRDVAVATMFLAELTFVGFPAALGCLAAKVIQFFL